MLENECFLPLWYMNVLSVFVQLIGATWLRATLPPFSSIPGISSRLASRSLPTDPTIRGEHASHHPIRDELVSPPPIRDELGSHPPIRGELASHSPARE